MGKWNFHICDSCQSIYKSYYCHDCNDYPKDDCKKHHKCSGFKRLHTLARLKRGIDLR